MNGRTPSRVIPWALTLLGMTSVTIAGCGTAKPDSTLERNKELVRQMNAEVWNKANVDAIDGFFTPDFVLHCQWLSKPPTGRRVQVDEMSIFRIGDGHIAEQWLLPDMSSMQEQLNGAGDG
jgi:hypothetical protein